VRARGQANARRYRAKTDVGAALRRVLRTLERTPAGERLQWRLESPDAAVAALDEQDLMELLGNLLENAAKWARQRVEIEMSAQQEIEVRIGDDGPGVAEDQLSRLGERGLRLDQRTAGSGLGLAIARDVAEAYGARLEFGRSGLGGLAARVWLPRAPSG
jgi:signal transduction histidine kinase